MIHDGEGGGWRWPPRLPALLKTQGLCFQVSGANVGSLVSWSGLQFKEQAQAMLDDTWREATS